MTTPGTATGIHDAPKAKSPQYQHPLDPLTADEITAVTATAREYATTKAGIKAVRFITCYLLPPPKKAVLAQLGIPLEPGAEPEAPTEIVRKAEVDFLDLLTGDAYNALISHTPTTSTWTLTTLTKLPTGTQPQISVEELIAAEKIVREDSRVQALAKEVGVKPHQIYADGWSIGYDERFPKSQRVQQAFLYARFGDKDENLYAHPLDFIPVISSTEGKVLHIDLAPHYTSSPSGEPVLSVSSTAFPPLDAPSETLANRPRIPPPKNPHEFLPEKYEETEGKKLREDVKPLHIVQPEGVSFKLEGHVLEWQKWKMHIAFGHREGIVLSTITYNDDGVVRPVFYRLSLAEMVVPYGAPEYPHPRKFAFDSGEYGMGTMANELSLGCDCLGQIHYLPGAYVANNGSAVVIKNVICIHEEDSGVLWKHTDYRVGGRGHTVRRRRLVVSMVCTLANYEYIFNYHFYQDGNIELEIRLTGILQVYVTQDGEPNPHGTTIAPNINAHYHQHLFSVRIDPMIDGLNNSVVETDVLAMPGAETGSAANWAGNAFVTEEKVLKDQKADGARDYDWEKDRRWRIVNPSKAHYASGKSVGYGIMMKGGTVPLLPREDSWVAKRAGFTKKALWVVKDVEKEDGGRMWPAGKYVPQTREEPEDSVPRWSKGEGSIENEDILVYLTVGTTHIPRPEDWPVMPVEHLNITFKPLSFFKANPGMDVPGSKDTHSVPAYPNGELGGYAVTGQSSSSCCA